LDDGARFEAFEFDASYGVSIVLVASLGSGAVIADGRPWKYFGSVKFWPISAEPMTLPSFSIRLPPASDAGHRQWQRDAGQQGKQHDQHDRGAKMGKHRHSPFR
jgi:hypothetical protein